jgi:thiol-disulfide isomerase/thioredoxin
MNACLTHAGPTQAGLTKTGLIKTILLTICLLLTASVSATDNSAADNTANGYTANNNTGDNGSIIEPPFGIRHFNAGIAPNFSLQDLDGETFELDSTRGSWVFLHFWASWCGPCRKEMPTFQLLANTMHDEKFEIVMVNTAEDEDTIFEFLASIGVDINSLIDSDGEVTEVWKPRGLPTSFLIDPEGQIRYQAIGGRDWHTPEYTDFLKKLMHHQAATVKPLQ